MDVIQVGHRLSLRIQHGEQLIEIPLRDDHHGLDSLTAMMGPGLVILGDHSGFAQLEQGYIEALVVQAGPEPAASTFEAYEQWDSYRPKALNAVSPNGTWQVELSPGSDAFWCLRERFVDTAREWNRDEPTYTTLKIRGQPLPFSTEALRRLMLVADSWSFDIDGEHGLGFRLALRPPWPPAYPRRRHNRAQQDAATPAAAAPTRTYQAEALAFYWYARSMPRAPFVQFLAFYQVLEYHFTRYAHDRGVQEVAALLTDPSIDLHSTALHRKVFQAVTSASRSTRTELAQLRATIEGSATAVGLKQRILSDQALKDHLREPILPGVAPVRVNANTPPSGVAEATAKRVYEQRCMIVHSKEGHGAQILLLPQTPQFLAVERDLPLMRYLARAVLTANSSPLAL